MNIQQNSLSINDIIRPLPATKVRLTGRLGEGLRRSIANRLKKVDYGHLVEPFRQRNERDGFWRCEFWGKIVRSSIQSWRGEPDEELKQKITCTVDDLISTQDHHGCICSYPQELQTQDWDIWGRKYVLLGLVRYYQEIAPDLKVKDAIVREIDYLMTQVGPEARNIIECGHHNGLAATSILEPVVLAYLITDEKRFLDFAQWIADQGGSTVNNVFEAIRKGVPPFALGNGKAYEMMSCFEGLAELYRVTGRSDYRESVLALYQAIRDQEIFITGVGGLRDQWGEFWDSGKIRQSQQNVGALGETCVTTTWIKLCGQVLRLTGDPSVVDEMERTLYNGVLGAMVPDGSWWMHRNPTPLAGASSKMRAGDQIPGFGEDCCVAQGPKALAMAPWVAIMQDDLGPIVNLYESAEATIEISPGRSIRLLIEGDYPRNAQVQITVETDQAVTFPLRLRIPTWSRETEISVGSESLQAKAGSYVTIERAWSAKDVISIRFDMRPRVIRAFDGGRRMTIMRGPVVLAQDSRLGSVDVRLRWNQEEELSLKPVASREAILETYQLPDGSLLCDYASAGNEFSETNQLCVWLRHD